MRRSWRRVPPLANPRDRLLIWLMKGKWGIINKAANCSTQYLLQHRHLLLEGKYPNNTKPPRGLWISVFPVNSDGFLMHDFLWEMRLCLLCPRRLMSAAQRLEMHLAYKRLSEIRQFCMYTSWSDKPSGSCVFSSVGLFLLMGGTLGGEITGLPCDRFGFRECAVTPTWQE